MIASVDTNNRSAIDNGAVSVSSGESEEDSDHEIEDVNGIVLESKLNSDMTTEEIKNDENEEGVVFDYTSKPTDNLITG